MPDLGQGQVWRYPGSGDNYVSFANGSGFATYNGTARFKDQKPFPFNYARLIGQGKPTLVSRGIFYGFSLPVYNSDDEELFSCICIPENWDTTTNPTIYIGGWLDTANTSKNFKLQVSVEHWTAGDAVPTTSTDVEIQTETGTAAQYKTFKIPFEYDAVSAGVLRGDAVGIRVRRIDASANEIAGEFIVEGAIFYYTRNRLGGTV